MNIFQHPRVMHDHDEWAYIQGEVLNAAMELGERVAKSGGGDFTPLMQLQKRADDLHKQLMLTIAEVAREVPVDA
jgi:hypothetical protein